MAQILDLQEWDECLGKMIRYHSNISMEIRDLILKIRDWRNENSSLIADKVETVYRETGYSRVNTDIVKVSSQMGSWVPSVDGVKSDLG